MSLEGSGWGGERLEASDPQSPLVVIRTTRALDAAAEAAPTAVELQVVEEKSAPAAKPVSV